jgi:hypothetical protein
MVVNIYKIIKDFLLKEVYDKPFNNLSKIDYNTYIVDEDGFGVKYNIKDRYDVEIIPKNYIKEGVEVFSEISWEWTKETPQELKTVYNWLRSTTTSFKVIDRFIREENPNVIMFSATEKTFNVYNSDLFIDHLKSLFGQKYYIVKDLGDDVLRVFIIKKSVSYYSDDMVNKTYGQCGGDIEDIKKRILKPNKNDYKGIRRNDLIKEQIKRIILKKRYL